jgi:hypothetical protein
LTKIVKEIPFLYLLLIPGMLGFAGIYLFSMMREQTAAMVISAVFLALVLLIHDRRRDYRFMHVVAASPWRVFGMEYLLLAFPLLLVLSVHRHWIIAGALLAVVLLIALKKQTVFQLKSGFAVPKFIRYSLFELRCGIRRYGLLLLVVCLIAWGTLPFPYVSLGVFWFFTLILADLFRTSEPLNIICTPELPPAGFLHRKLKENLTAYLCLLAPLCLACLAVHPEDWWLSAYYLLAMTTNAALVIASKYAHYSPGEKIMGGQIAIIISFCCVAVPILYPLTLFYLIKNYPAARRNLKIYLDAYDTKPACSIR